MKRQRQKPNKPAPAKGRMPRPVVKAKAETANAVIYSRSEESRASDAVPRNQCPRCGLVGVHPTASDCISALRDRLAEKRK